MNKSCVFCELIATGHARWVAVDRSAVAFLPLPDSVIAPGHTLVALRRHCVGVLDADPADLAATIVLAQRVAQAMRQGLNATGVNVLNATGEGSGQSVRHLHLHVVPRWPDDDEASLPWPTQHSRHTLPGDPRALLVSALDGMANPPAT